MLWLHLRYRFDPEGLSETEKTRLARGMEEWLVSREAALRYTASGVNLNLLPPSRPPPS